MKIRSTLISFIALGIGVVQIVSCTKVNSLNNTSPVSAGYSKDIPEIGLGVTFNFQRDAVDDLSIRLSNNFSIEQQNSLFNSNQQVEYFTLRCKKNDGTVYLINGTVDSTDAVTIAYQKTDSINY